MRSGKCWTLDQAEAISLLQQIEQKISASDIDVRHRDVLIRLRSIIESDLSEDGKPFERIATKGTNDMSGALNR